MFGRSLNKTLLATHALFIKNSRLILTTIIYRSSPTLLKSHWLTDGCSPVNLTHFLRTHFYKSTSEGNFLYVFYFQFQVVYFTAIFPFVFLGGLLLRFLFLDGATDVGLNYMFSGRVKNNVKAICYWQMWPKAKQRFSVFLFSRDNITKLLLVFHLKILWRNLKHITAIFLRSKFKFIRKVY